MVRPRYSYLKFFIYLYTFIVFYMPRISDLFIGVNIEVFSVLLLMIMIFPWVTICKKRSNLFSINKNVFYLMAGITVSALYFVARALIASTDIRILQNLFILVQIFHILIIFDFMKYIGLNKDDIIKVLFNLAFIQGIITILMLIFPTTKNIALSLYYLGREENIFISRMRIYGISGDYTFFTPIYHSILASLVFFYSIFKDRKYMLYLPLILLVILLNGRFGLLIFMISPILTILYFLSKAKLSFKMVKITIIAMAIFVVGILLLSIISPYTYTWIVGGFRDTIKLIVHKEKTGNYVALAGSHLSLPQGKGLLIGEGYRLFGGQGSKMGYNSSDIGYVNDIFMGGIIYITILYGSILRFLLRRVPYNYFCCKKDYVLQSLTSIHLAIALLVANYKGEVMRGGSVILVVIFIKIVLSTDISYETYEQRLN